MSSCDWRHHVLTVTAGAQVGDSEPQFIFFGTNMSVPGTVSTEPMDLRTRVRSDGGRLL
jgi:hypothetical protein